MAKEYIDREAALTADFVINAPMFESRLKTAERAVETYAEYIASIPAADVVEVVRCKNCKYRDDVNYCEGRGWPEQLVPDDGYCDKGAKMDGDNDV